MRNVLGAGICGLVIALMPLSSAYAGAEPLLGEISVMAGSVLPQGYAYCDGSRIAITANTALYSIIGPTGGSYDRTYFQLPDYRGLEAPLKGGRYIIAVKGRYPARQ